MSALIFVGYLIFFAKYLDKIDRVINNLKRGSSQRCPLHSHSMVHTENNFCFLGIQPLLDQDIIKLFLWWYLFSACYFRREQVLWDTFVIYIKYDIINYFIFVSVKMDFWSNYISQSFQFSFLSHLYKKMLLSCFGCCCTNHYHEQGKFIDAITVDSKY